MTDDPAQRDRRDPGAGPVRDGGGPSHDGEPNEDVGAVPEHVMELVERQRDLARQTAREAQRQIELARSQAERLRLEVSRLTQRLDEIQGRPEVRASGLLRGGVRRIRRGVARLRGRRRPPRPRASVAAERRLVEDIRRQATGLPRVSGPLVSIVMLNRNGATLLRRCLPSLARTSYRDVELVFVDNASTDDSLAVLATTGLPFPVRVIRNDTNPTFSEANNRALPACRGDLVLFLNNDIEPIEPGWLGHMVETLLDRNATAVGARLVYPRAALGAGTWSSPPLSLQHAGVAFRLADGAPLPIPQGVGTDPLAPRAAEIREVPALTAACLLVRRHACEAAGGFPSEYEYGLEDVDLCLALVAAGGRLVYDGRTALWHHESATRAAEAHTIRQARVAANRARFIDRWGPRLYRTVMADVLSGGTFWRQDPLTVRLRGVPLAEASAARIAAELTTTVGGVRVSALDAEVDVEVIADPGIPPADLASGPIRVAVVTGDVDAWLTCPWLPDADVIGIAGTAAEAAHLESRTGRPPIVLEEGSAGAALHAGILQWVLAPRVTILVDVPTWPRALMGGDLPFARDLQRALERAGRRTRVRPVPEWTSGAAARDDVTIQLLGRTHGPTRSGQLNILWHISHPDSADPQQYRRFNLVLAASAPFAARMSTLAGCEVHALLQATDPQRFHPAAEGPAHELLFVANSRRTGRHLIEDLLPTPHNLAVYGQRWDRDGLDPRYWAGEHIENEQLPGYYARAEIVLNDHWVDMRREAFLSNRLFDASAAGAFVISDAIETLEDTFDGGVIAYKDAAELRRLVDHYLRAPEERRACAARARAAVLARHTFAHRAAEILALVAPLEAGRSSTVANLTTGSGDR